MAPKSRPDRARDEVARLEQVVRQWRETADDADRRLADLQESRGDEVLAAGEGGAERARELAREVAELREDAATARDVAAVAESKLAEARADVLRADAAQLRDEAAAMHAEADQRQATTDALLAELREHEGVDYRAMTLATRASGGEEWVPASTRTRRLRADADERIGRAVVLEGQADGLEIVPPNLGDGPDHRALADPAKAAVARAAARLKVEQAEQRHDAEERRDRAQELHRELDGAPLRAVS